MMNFLFQHISKSLKEINSVPIIILEKFTQFIFANLEFLNDTLVFEQLVDCFQQKETFTIKFNFLLPTFYNITKISLKFRNSPKNHIDSLKRCFFENVISKLEENGLKLRTWTVYEEGIKQNFTPNIRKTYFENFVYILPMMKLMGFPIQNHLEFLIPQLERDCVNWTGELLVENILILSEHKVVTN